MFSDNWRWQLSNRLCNFVTDISELKTHLEILVNEVLKQKRQRKGKIQSYLL